ncbi:MAG TPA: zinc ribbon domain-containing protein [Armatimonadetes bacterium]|nr:zinc ribbon domain-containing protein [Armatimonadota bacterium]
MPIYEYRCRQCGETFEVLVRGEEMVTCPRCGSGDLQKLISRFSVKNLGKYVDFEKVKHFARHYPPAQVRPSGRKT